MTREATTKHHADPKTASTLTERSSMPTTQTAPATPNPAPVTTTSSSPVVLSTSPPVVNIPVPPTEVMPIDLGDYRGTHPKAAQSAAAPDVVLELSNTTVWESTFGPAAPAVAPFAQVLKDAVGWSALRNALETYLVYVKSQEAVQWKAGLLKMEQVKPFYNLAVAHDATVADAFPALTRLLGAQSVIAKRAAASRKRKATKVATATSASTARAVSTATPTADSPTVATTTTPVSGGTTGGAGH
jgi:hypothetical protein